MHALRFLAAVLVCLAVSAGTAWSASDRVALVVGNNDYRTLPDLKNARKDASDVAATLEGLGWEVILLLDSSQRDLGRAIETFEGRLTTAQAGLMFYAGHGVQARGENWLIPSDANVESEVDLRYESVSARDILEAMKRSGTPLNIVILDACRDNPLPTATRSTSRGLAVPAMPQGIKGTAVLFSAAPGETAQDGPAGGNGVFTGALLETLEQPGLKLEELFKRTARRVSELTANKQRPWFNSSVFGDFYFNDRAAAPARAAPATASTPPATPSAPSPQVAVQQVEIVFWQSIQDSDQPALFESYLEQFPNGAFAPLARAKLQLLRGTTTARTEPQVAARPATPAPRQNANRPPPPRREAERPVAPAAAAPSPKPTGQIASRPPAGTGRVAERAEVERILADERDDLRRDLGDYMTSSGHALSVSFDVQQIWKARLVETTADGHIVEIRYDAMISNDRSGIRAFTQRFLVRLDGDALEFLDLIPDRG